MFLERIDAMIHEHICHPNIVHKPSLASTSQTLNPGTRHEDDYFRYKDKRAAKKNHRSSVKKFHTSVKKSRTQTLI